MGRPPEFFRERNNTMSYQTWHNYGFGISTELLETANVSRIKALIHCAPSYEATVANLFQDSGTIEPIADDYLELERNNSYGIASIMADVIEEAENLLLTACNNFDGTNYLLYMPSYPWGLRVDETSLTEERVREIIEKYAAILSDEPVEVGYESVENGG